MDADRGTTLATAEAARAAVAAFTTTAAGAAVDTCGTGTAAAAPAATAAGPAIAAKASYRLRILALRRQRTATIAAAAARPAGTIIATPTGTGVSALRVQPQEAGRSAINDDRARAPSTAAAGLAGFERCRTRPPGWPGSNDVVPASPPRPPFQPPPVEAPRVPPVWLSPTLAFPPGTPSRPTPVARPVRSVAGEPSPSVIVLSRTAAVGRLVR